MRFGYVQLHACLTQYEPLMTVWKLFIFSFFTKLTRSSKYRVLFLPLCSSVMCFLLYCLHFMSPKDQNEILCQSQSNNSCSKLQHCEKHCYVALWYVPSERWRQTAQRIKVFILCFIDQSLDGLRRGNGMVEMAVHREVEIKSQSSLVCRCVIVPVYVGKRTMCLKQTSPFLSFAGLQCWHSNHLFFLVFAVHSLCSFSHCPCSYSRVCVAAVFMFP